MLQAIHLISTGRLFFLNNLRVLSETPSLSSAHSLTTKHFESAIPIAIKAFLNHDTEKKKCNSEKEETVKTISWHEGDLKAAMIKAEGRLWLCGFNSWRCWEPSPNHGTHRVPSLSFSTWNANQIWWVWRQRKNLSHESLLSFPLACLSPRQYTGAKECWTWKLIQLVKPEGKKCCYWYRQRTTQNNSNSDTYRIF